MAGNRWILWFVLINRRISHFSNCQKYSVLQFFVWSDHLNQFQGIHSFLGLVLLDFVLVWFYIIHVTWTVWSICLQNSQAHIIRDISYVTFFFRLKILRTNPKSAFAFSKKRTLYFCGLSFWNSNALENNDLKRIEIIEINSETYRLIWSKKGPQPISSLKNCSNISPKSFKFSL